MIPRLFHHIWINRQSPLLPPQFAGYRQSWMTHHPHWQFRLWNLDNLDFALRRPELLAQATSYAQLADVLRLEVLLHHGGVYVDTDFECFKAIDALVEGAHVFFCSEDGRSITNAIIGAEPRAALIERLLDGIGLHIGQGQPSAETGPRYVTRQILHGGFDGGLTVLPSPLFFPYAMGEPRITAQTAGGAYAAHHWAHSWSDPAERKLWSRLRRKLVGAPVKRPVLEL